MLTEANLKAAWTPVKTEENKETQRIEMANSVRCE